MRVGVSLQLVTLCQEMKNVMVKAARRVND
jgi:hypothetical protein